jgi:hypothetical protein
MKVNLFYPELYGDFMNKKFCIIFIVYLIDNLGLNFNFISRHIFTINFTFTFNINYSFAFN